AASMSRRGEHRLSGAVRKRGPDGPWPREAMREPRGTERWSGSFFVEVLGRQEFQVEAWVDRFASFQDELRRKHEGGQRDLASELVEGAALLEAIAKRVRGPAKAELRAAAARIGGDDPVAERVAAALEPAPAEAAPGQPA